MFQIRKSLNIFVERVSMFLLNKRYCDLKKLNTKTQIAKTIYCALASNSSYEMHFTCEFLGRGNKIEMKKKTLQQSVRKISMWEIGTGFV